MSVVWFYSGHLIRRLLVSMVTEPESSDQITELTGYLKRETQTCLHLGLQLRIRKYMRDKIPAMINNSEVDNGIFHFHVHLRYLPLTSQSSLLTARAGYWQRSELGRVRGGIMEHGTKPRLQKGEELILAANRQEGNLVLQTAV
ncbi:hypothetical protein Bbelb_136650 [Branchiostoma belcheri]|nr:hypothetical protein Bbelb_136650 [Branchiostoma belcheri]